MKFGPETVFDADHLLACYASGVFPMSDDRDDPELYLVDPPLRGVLPLHGFHVSKRLARTVRQDRFQARIDTAFPQVIAACAEPEEGREETWINHRIEALYGDLFARGRAHSVETWLEGELVGGLYGVTLGGAFFGESMFSTETDASKVALVHLVARLSVGGYRLLDVQFMTDHLAQFGAEELPRRAYLKRLEDALLAEGDFYAFQPLATGAEALQAISQRS